MKREEATTLLREIYTACDGINEKGVLLMAPNSNDVLSHGYQLHLKGQFADDHIDCIAPLVSKSKLAMAREDDKELLIIYRPTKNAITK